VTQILHSLSEVADAYDAIVLDQWGVLHDGTAPYPDAKGAIDRLSGRRLAVLSNSGKRAGPNADRIAAMGFDASRFEYVMTSGEALHRNIGHLSMRLFAIEGASGDAGRWAGDAPLEFVNDPSDAEAALLMGLPDGSAQADYAGLLQSAFTRGLPMYCSNPDLKSPRGGGVYVMSSGALAQRYADMGGTVYLYGKPHGPIFQAMQSALGCPPDRILMVGDSLHHDIHGAAEAGWHSALIQAGIHAPDLPHLTSDAVQALAARSGVAAPTYALSLLR